MPRNKYEQHNVADHVKADRLTGFSSPVRLGERILPHDEEDALNVIQTEKARLRRVAREEREERAEKRRRPVTLPYLKFLDDAAS